MRQKINTPILLSIWVILLFITSTSMSYAGPLTPPREPKENSFYICYERCRIKYSIKAPLALYRKYQYVGCTIETRPCDDICKTKNKVCRYKLKLFDWFDNYPHALNAFYRCAYS